MRGIIISSLAVILFVSARASINLNSSEISPCLSKPDFIQTKGQIIPGGIEALPKVLHVAKQVESYIEGEQTQVYFKQSFINSGNSSEQEPMRAICGSSRVANRPMVISAPTLLDLTHEKKLGNSIWQMRAYVDAKQIIGSFKHSPLLSRGSLNQVLALNKADTKVYKTQSGNYEVVFKKEINGVRHYLSVKFEPVSEKSLQGEF